MYHNSHSEGTCVLLEIPSMHKLVQYFQTLHRNEDIYELKGVHIAAFEPHLFSSNVENCNISNVFKIVTNVPNVLLSLILVDTVTTCVLCCNVCIEDVHIFKHCREITLFLLWIGTHCISCVVQQTSGVKDLSSLVRYDDSSLAAIRHVQSIIPVVRPRPNYAHTASCLKE